MKVTFFSNFLNHHQTPFCNEMRTLLGDNFTFVSTTKTPESFLEGGYPDCEEISYNLRSYLNDENFKMALRLGFDSDVVITGSAPDIFIKERLKKDKLTFRYSERIFKKGHVSLFSPRAIFSLTKKHTIHRNKNLYMLCASAYTSNDLSLVFAYPKKMFKWGYFTEVPQLDIYNVIKNKPKEKIALLWVGRFIDWKHPEMAVVMMQNLIESGYDVHLTMIGSGTMLEYIRGLIDTLSLNEHITLAGNMPNREVRNKMLQSNVVLLTSNRNEGWGAVLNEAMSCGCVAIGSHLMGSVPFLVENEKNGLIFESRNIQSLTEQTERVLKNINLKEEIGRNAYHTMTNTWSPQNAAEKFILQAESILKTGTPARIAEGPCSFADRTIKSKLIKTNK